MCMCMHNEMCMYMMHIISPLSRDFMVECCMLQVKVIISTKQKK